MNVLSLGSPFGSSRFYSTLVTLIERLKTSDAFLAEEDLETMARLLPLRHVHVVTTQLSSLICKDQVSELPRSFAQVVRFDVQRKVVCAAGPVLLVILVRDGHYSAVVVDCVDRLGHVFDSSPSASHRESAQCLLDNLHRCNVIDTSDVVERHEFRQTSTQCGLFVLSLAMHLDAWLTGEPELMRSRTDCIRDAMEAAADNAQIGRFRADMHSRVSNAAICLFNARPSGHDIHSHPLPPAPESFEQSDLLGPHAARAPLYRLCTAGQAATRLFVDTLASMLPESIPIGLHEIVEKSTTVPADAVRLLREHQFSLIIVTSAPPDPVVHCASLLVADTSSSECHLFMPTGNSLDTGVQTALDAVRAATGARAFTVADNTMRGATPAALPLSIFMWWAHINRVVPDDEVGAELVAACRAAVLPTPLRMAPALCDDWIFRRIFCTALDSAHRALTDAACALESDPLVSVMTTLSRPLMIARSAARAVRRNTQEISSSLQHLDKTAAETIEYSDLHAPMRWRAGMDAAGFAAMYSRVLDLPSAWVLQEKIAETFDAARRASAIGLDTGAVWRTVLTVVEAVAAAWPCMVIAMADGPSASAIALDCEQLIPTLRQALGTPLGTQPPLVVCPVAVLDDETYTLRSIVSVCTMRDMQRRSELSLDLVCEAAMVSGLPYLSTSLTGSVKDTAPSTHVMGAAVALSKKNVPQFINMTRNRVSMPAVFVKTGVRRRADPHCGAAAGDDFSASSSLSSLNESCF